MTTFRTNHVPPVTPPPQLLSPDFPPTPLFSISSPSRSTVRFPEHVWIPAASLTSLSGQKTRLKSAIAASLDPSFGITLNSNRVEVMWASDSVPQWREGVKNKEASSSSSSKLLKPELPLRRHGRGNKLGSSIMNLRDDKTYVNNENNSVRSRLTFPSRGREIIAYDDIL